MIKDNQEFEETRKLYISQVAEISRMLKHQRNMKKIKKECMKNMVAGPSLIDLSACKQSSSYSKKDSIHSKSVHKNSMVGPCYNSDSEKEGSKAIHVINREAKNWQQTLDRQSSHDLL
jgi:hypothetical protein